MKHRPYFPQTASALQSVTDLYDFLWPTAVALWNLRWQVAGFDAARKPATVLELKARFIDGSGISGANLVRACIDTSWEAQTTQLAGVLLTNLFATYEGWAKQLTESLSLRSGFPKELQFPGASAKIAALSVSATRLVEDSVYPILIKRPRYDWPRLETLLACYRYFKEVRNAQIHNGAIGDLKGEQAYQAFAAVATSSHMASVPEHVAVNAGAPVKLTLRGVVGFSDVLRRMLYSIDAELSKLPAAEAVLETEWRRVSSKGRTFKHDRVERHRQLRSVFAKIGFSVGAITTNVEAELQKRKLAIW